MNKVLLTILVILATGFSGCKDDAYAPPPPSSSATYFPQTKGSTWKYRDSTYNETTAKSISSSPKVDTITFRINGASTDFNSLKCYNVDVTSVLNGANTAYFYAGDHLFSLLEWSLLYGLTNLQMLKDTASAGYTWLGSPLCTSTITTPIASSPTRTISTIIDKNILRKVGGKTYGNVIHTSVTLQTDFDGSGFNTLAYYDFYLAKGVGLIEKDTHIYGLKYEVETLISFNITQDPVAGH
jgi:hypothetical protein